MKHPDEDTLIKMILDLLERAEMDDLASHLEECRSCKERYESLRAETEMIGSLEPDIPAPFVEMPSAAGGIWRALIRAAALLLVGFAAGYGFSRVSRPEDFTVVPYARVVSVPAQTVYQFAVCESVNLGDRN